MLARVAAEQDSKPRPAITLERALSLLIVLLVAYRIAYHASYLGDVPFAHATFSDGASYEQAARDILEHPPLGRAAFYLQGAYAYLLALGMAIQPWPSFGLLVQLVLAFATLALFHRTAIRLWGRRAGLLSSAALLAYPGLAFYENKYLSAELGIACNVLVIAAFVGLLQRDGRARVGMAVLLGLASGLAMLARPNMILALPFSLVAMVSLIDADDLRTRLRKAMLPAAGIVLGTMLALAPMAWRNLVVTGHPDVQPIHGGGTSFFIGNNPKSKGVWNDAGMLSARLGTESSELAAALEIDPELDDRDRAKAIGEALYARSFTWIRQNPGTWAKLELSKLWLTIGDQHLTQDYDWLGERELLPWAHRIGVSFSRLLALGLLGAGAVGTGRFRPSEDAAVGRRWSDRERRAVAWMLAGQVLAPLAANLLFFTSAQHRLPIAIPLALLVGPGIVALGATLRSWRGSGDGRGALPIGLLVAAGLLLVQGPWPRTRQTQPHPVHYYNLAMVEDSIGDPLAALGHLDRAIEQRPEQPMFLLRRAHLRVRIDDIDGAEQDLDALAQLAEREAVPEWVLAQARIDRRTIAHARGVEALGVGRR